MKYAIVIEKTDNGYSGYVPDLPGCVAAGDSRAETEDLLRETVPFHVELLRENGDPVPAPRTLVAVVDVPATDTDGS